MTSNKSLMKTGGEGGGVIALYCMIDYDLTVEYMYIS